MAGMTQQEIADMMRLQELQRRESRRVRLMNEIKLYDEPLDEQARTANTAALTELKRQHLEFDKLSHPSYWRRLWNAILGR